MQTLISIYDSHQGALEGVLLLKEAGFSQKHISLLGSASGDADFKEDEENATVAAKGMGIGAIVGPLAGALTGIGVFAIPGFGFLFGAGALVGAIAGFDIGIIGGGLIASLALSGVHHDMEKKYEADLKAGKTLLIFQGDSEAVTQAKTLLEQHGMHVAVNLHG